jgi:hypothetical protein
MRDIIPRIRTCGRTSPSVRNAPAAMAAYAPASSSGLTGAPPTAMLGWRVAGARTPRADRVSCGRTRGYAHMKRNGRTGGAEARERRGGVREAEWMERIAMPFCPQAPPECIGTQQQPFVKKTRHCANIREWSARSRHSARAQNNLRSTVVLVVAAAAAAEAALY